MSDEAPPDVPAGLGRFRALFPATARYAYFLTAAVSPTPLPVLAAIESCLRDNSLEAARAFDRWLAAMERCRGRLGRLLGCAPSEVAFTKNTSQGIQIAARSIPWKTGDNVLLNDAEFPANVFPWQEVARTRGIEVRFVPAREGRVDAGDLARALDARTRAISISWVQFSNGFRCDLAAISTLCEEKGLYLVVDAVQGVGALEIDLAAFGPRTMVAGGCHKWLLCPPGIGYLRCPGALLDELEPANWGWISMTDPLRMTHELRLKPDAGRFEDGILNFAGICGLEASLTLIEEAGIREIERHNLALNALLADRLLAKGCRIVSPWREAERSAILLFAHPSLPADAVCRALARADVMAVERDGGVRVSPHFFNSPDDVARLVAALP